MRVFLFNCLISLVLKKREIKDRKVIREVVIRRELTEKDRILKLARNHMKNDISKIPSVFEKIYPLSIKREKMRLVMGYAINPKTKYTNQKRRM